MQSINQCFLRGGWSYRKGKYQRNNEDVESFHMLVS